METSTVTRTPKLGKIELEMLEYIVANLGDPAVSYDQPRRRYGGTLRSHGIP